MSRWSENEADNLHVLDNLPEIPRDNWWRINFQTVQGIEQDESTSIIYGGWLVKRFNDTNGLPGIGVLVTDTVLVGNRKTDLGTFKLMADAFHAGEELPTEEGIVELPASNEVQSFLLKDVVHPIFTALKIN